MQERRAHLGRGYLRRHWGLCTNLNEISRSYQEAQSARDYSAIMGEGRAIYIKDVEPDTSVQLQFGEQEERALINAIKLGGKRRSPR